MKTYAFGLLAAAVLAPAALADVTLSIVTASSSLTMGGSIDGATLSAQGTGGNTTTYTGSVVISNPGSSFSFVSADGAANNSGNWQPLVGGASGTAPANYGMKATLVVQLNAAGRGIHLGLSGGPITLTGTSFPMSAATASILSGTIDYNAGAFGTGTGSLAGLTAAAGSGNGSLVVSGSNVTLTLPVNSTLSTTIPTGTILGDIPVVVTLTGTIVATGTLPPQNGACCRGTTCAVTTAAACPVQANQKFLGVGTVCNTAGNHATPCCNANFNQDAGVSVQDIFDFLNAWFAGDPAADFNGGGINVQDIFDFLNAWFVGC